jgi:hypothetical protein
MGRDISVTELICDDEIRLDLSPPTGMGPTFTEITGYQGPTCVTVASR